MIFTVLLLSRRLSAFTQKTEQKVLMTVLTRSETNRLRIYLRHLDPHAFYHHCKQQ